jgi:hypothetical protein
MDEFASLLKAMSFLFLLVVVLTLATSCGTLSGWVMGNALDMFLPGMTEICMVCSSFGGFVLGCYAAQSLFRRFYQW